MPMQRFLHLKGFKICFEVPGIETPDFPNEQTLFVFKTKHMIVYTTAKTNEEILQILELQKSNLPQNLTDEQIATQGFVTVNHSFDTLKKMNTTEQSIIAKDNDRVIGYLLAMTAESKNDIPVLIPMFDAFDNVVYNNKKISEYKYIVVGQVCIAEGWRGQGILDNCYAAYKKHFRDKYDFAITEISV